MKDFTISVKYFNQTFLDTIVSNFYTVSMQNYENVICALNTAGINLLAIDFDYTLISFHTHGTYYGGAMNLAGFIRPCFKAFIPLALDNQLNICVVTFSGQTKLILETIKIGFPNHWNRIVVRTNDPCWGRGFPSKKGKQKHIASAVEEIEKQLEVPINISKKSTLLIDDDRDNIKIAIDDGVPALCFDIKDPESMITDIIEFGSFCSNRFALRP